MSVQTSAPQLRPLGVGEILDVGIKIYLRNALTLFKIVVFVVLPAQILVNFIEISALPSNVTLSSGSTRRDYARTYGAQSSHTLGGTMPRRMPT